MDPAPPPPPTLTELLKDRLNLTAHADGPLPCLCRGCLDPALERVERQGLAFVREFALSEKRVLLFWVPEQLLPERDKVRHAVEVALAAKLQRRRG